MIHIDEVEFYLEHVSRYATGDEVARWMGLNPNSFITRLRRKEHHDIADQLVRNAIRRGANVKLKEAS